MFKSSNVFSMFIHREKQHNTRWILIHLRGSNSLRVLKTTRQTSLEPVGERGKCWRSRNGWKDVGRSYLKMIAKCCKWRMYVYDLYVTKRYETVALSLFLFYTERERERGNKIGGSGEDHHNVACCTSSRSCHSGCVAIDFAWKTGSLDLSCQRSYVWANFTEAMEV